MLRSLSDDHSSRATNETMRIQTKITTIGISFTVATALIITGILIFKQGSMNREIGTLDGQIHQMNDTVAANLTKTTEAELDKLNKIAGELIGTTDQFNYLRLKHSLAIAKEQLAALGPIRLNSEMVEWKCDSARN
jgi:hypothetical protein